MQKLRFLGLIIIIVFLSFSCEDESQISVIPENPELNLKAGATGTFTFKVTDNERIIAAINGYIIEYPDFTLALNDNGESGDENAQDGIWSTEINVPGTAPSGKYNFVFEVFDTDKNSIMTITETGEEVKLTAKTVLIIK